MGYSRKPSKRLGEVAMSIPIAIGWRSISNDHAELTPLMDFILLGRIPIRHSNYKNYSGHHEKARKILK